MALILYTHPFSSYSQKVLIALYENGTAFEPRMVVPETMEGSRRCGRCGASPSSSTTAARSSRPASSSSIWASTTRAPSASCPRTERPRSRCACWIASSTITS